MSKFANLSQQVNKSAPIHVSNKISTKKDGRKKTWQKPNTVYTRTSLQLEDRLLQIMKRGVMDSDKYQNMLEFMNQAIEEKLTREKFL